MSLHKISMVLELAGLSVDLPALKPIVREYVHNTKCNDAPLHSLVLIIDSSVSLEFTHNRICYKRLSLKYLLFITNVGHFLQELDN